MSAELHNWAGNYVYKAARLHQPETVEQLQELISQSRKVKILGSRHSFNDIADTSEDLISLAKLAPSIMVDHEHNSVTITGGITYGELGPQLDREGMALHNMASLPHISVVGACATATHGSGISNGNLATAVTAIEFVAANGELITLSRDANPDQFAGAVVNLGGIGAITKMTLATQPSFQVQQEVYDNLPVAQLDEHFDAIEASAYSVSLFTDWSNGRVNQVWLKRRVDDQTSQDLAPSFFGATLAPRPRHPIIEMPAEPCTVQMGIPGPWYQRLPHFRMEETPSNGEEIQSEYFVPFQHAVAAIRALTSLQERVSASLMISEIRTIAADALWMSPAYQQASVGLHFTWKRDWPAIQKLLPLIEEQLAPFGGRPHWGKVFTMAPQDVRSHYPRLADFQHLLEGYDPNGKFRNAFLDTYIFADGKR